MSCRYSFYIPYSNNKENDIIYTCVSKLNRNSYYYAPKLQVYKLFFNTIQEILPFLNDTLDKLERPMTQYNIYDHELECFQDIFIPEQEQEQEKEELFDTYSDCSSNCSIHDVTEKEVIQWLIEDGETLPEPVRRSARIANRVQKFGPTSYVEMISGVSKKESIVEQVQEPIVEQPPVRRSARIAQRAQKYGPTSYVGMDSIEPENEYDGITDIWYDYSKDPDSLDYDSDYESPEEIRLRLKKEKEAKKANQTKQTKQTKQTRKTMKKELVEAKKANDQMDLDIQEQIAEDIAKLTINTSKLSDEEYYNILKLKQNTDQLLTWDELNFLTDYAISLMKK